MLARVCQQAEIFSREVLDDSEDAGGGRSQAVSVIKSSDQRRC
jgi:hypothetical protein